MKGVYGKARRKRAEPRRAGAHDNGQHKRDTKTQVGEEQAALPSEGS